MLLSIVYWGNEVHIQYPTNSPVKLGQNRGQPVTNCNSNETNGISIRYMSTTIFQKFTQINIWEHCLICIIPRWLPWNLIFRIFSLSLVLLHVQSWWWCLTLYFHAQRTWLRHPYTWNILIMWINHEKIQDGCQI